MNLKQMSVSVQLMGGLGNQLFQISAGYALSKRYGLPFHLTGEFGGCGQGNRPVKYASTLYRNLTVSYPSNNGVWLKERAFAYSPLELTNLGRNYVLDGYFQSEQYFLGLQSELRGLFLTEADIAHAVASVADRLPALAELDDRACLLCVRRGDYLRHPRIHNPCGMDYYTKAMRACPADVYYIASDDLAWCRQHFVGPQYSFLDIGDDLTLFYIGTLFSKYIIGNSTYHWWMSYLSRAERPVVVAPDKWLFADKPASEHQTIYREDMIVIERAIEVD